MDNKFPSFSYVVKRDTTVAGFATSTLATSTRTREGEFCAPIKKGLPTISTRFMVIAHQQNLVPGLASCNYPQRTTALNAVFLCASHGYILQWWAGRGHRKMRRYLWKPVRQPRSVHHQRLASLVVIIYIIPQRLPLCWLLPLPKIRNLSG